MGPPMIGEPAEFTATVTFLASLGTDPM